MNWLLGEYEVAIDSKGRFLLPSGFKKQLTEGAGDRFVINRGFEKCLVLYPLESWKRVMDKVDKLNVFNPKARKVKRLLMNGANFVEPDGAGRLNLPKPLLEYAGITKDMVVSVQNDVVELWDKGTYRDYLGDNTEDLSELAAEVLGGDFTDTENL